MKSIHTIQFVVLILSVLMMTPFSGQAQIYKRDSLRHELLKEFHGTIKDYELQTDIDLFNSIIALLDEELANEEATLKSNRKKIIKESIESYHENLIELKHLRRRVDTLFNQLDFIQKKLFREKQTAILKTPKQYRKRKKELAIKAVQKNYKITLRRLDSKKNSLLLDAGVFEKLMESENNWWEDPFISELINYINLGIFNNQELVESKLVLKYDSLQQVLDERIISLIIEKEELNRDKKTLNKTLAEKRDTFKEIVAYHSFYSDSLQTKIKENERTLMAKEEELLLKIAALEATRLQLTEGSRKSEAYLAENKLLAKETTSLKEETLNLKSNTDALKEEGIKQSILNQELRDKKIRTELWLKILTGFSLLGIFLLAVSVNRISQNKQKISKAYKELEQTKNLLQTKTKELEINNKDLVLTTEKLTLSHKELNHRVKNNLQTISSLIYLQEDEIEDEKSLAVFESLQGKIEAIKIIHQKLYKGGNRHLTKVNMAEYVRSLIKYIVDDDAEIQLDLQEVFIDTDHATDIGLMLNELITNATKYAFPNTVDPKLEVQIKTENGMLNLLVKDNGNGFFEDFSIDKSNSYGLKSIVNLVKKTDKGILEIFNKEGANIFISMPFDKKEGKLIF